MRKLLASLTIVYLMGVSISLAPIIRLNWKVSSASQLVGVVARDLPSAMLWPMAAFETAGEAIRRRLAIFG
jgi:hypothetical protein